MMKNRIQIIPLILCLVLLIAVLGQNRQMRQQYEHLESEIHDLRMMLSDDIRSISSSIEQQLEEQQRHIAEYSLQPRGISKEDYALLADVSITLKNWYADTQLTLLAQFGDKQAELPMEEDKNGTFTAEIVIPLEDSCEIGLSVQISGGGRILREDVCRWSEISLLLPLRNSGGGWDGPNYLDGTMSSNFHITIEGRDGIPGPIENPRFQIYRNGVLTQTIPAVIDSYASASGGVCYTTDTQGHRWHLECALGDTVDIRFLCEDEYGLGYDFLYANWTASEDRNGTYNGSTFQSGNPVLTFYWPE